MIENIFLIEVLIGFLQMCSTLKYHYDASNVTFTNDYKKGELFAFAKTQYVSLFFQQQQVPSDMLANLINIYGISHILNGNTNSF